MRLSIHNMPVARMFTAVAAVGFILGTDAIKLRAGAAGLKRGQPMKEKMPWYHSTQEIRQELQDLPATCQGAEVQLTTRSRINSADAAGQEVELDVLHVRRSGTKPRTKALYVFGEHARELVSPESALDFLRTLCGHGRESQHAAAVLDHVEFTVVPNANPLGRQQVEEGFYCKRTNEDGVDLNRNWGDDHREHAAMRQGDEMDPGPSGFSEPESQILRDLIAEVKPDVFLSIHSGAYLLGAPYGYTSASTPENQANMVELLKPISEKYCGGSCPYGGLAELIGYASEGCDIDYVAEKMHTPFAYTWEIYVGPEIRRHYIEEARERSSHSSGEDDNDLFNAQKLNLAQRGSRRSSERRWEEHHLRGQRRLQQRDRSVSKISLGEWSEAPEEVQEPEDCIEQFIPRTAEETAQIVDNWTGAYLDLAEQVSKRLQAPANDKASSTVTLG